MAYDSPFDWNMDLPSADAYESTFVDPGAAYIPTYDSSMYADFGGGATDPGTQWTPPSMGAGSAAPSGPGQTSPWMGAALGSLGPLAGLIGNLTGGGVTGRAMPQMTTQQKALQGQGTQALGLLNPFAQGASPLQQQQAGILNPLSAYIQQLLGGGGAGTQGLINTLSPLIQQAYQPFAQGLMQQATQAGRQSGFYDAPGTSPPGGAILGPGLAQLQDQQAQSLLQAMLQQIPQAAISGAGAFNQPVNQQIGAAQGMASGYGNLIGPQGSQQSVPQGSQIGQNVATALGGAAQGYLGQQQQNQQRQFQNSLLNALGGGGGPQYGMSYTG